MTLEIFLKSVERSIHPPTEEINQGKEKMQSLFRLLQQNSKFKIDRCELVGSTAKKTSIAGYVDFDCIIFVNDQQTEVKTIVEDFQEVLLQHTDLEEEEIKLTPRRDPKTLQFELDHVEFDIGVAINEAKNHNNGNKAHKQQANNLLQKFRNGEYSGSQMYRLSSGLSKMAVDFVKKQSAFAHEIARLGKYWNKTLLLELEFGEPTYVSGRSSIMELIAIDAAKEEEKNSKSSASYLNAFKIFLCKIRDIKSMKINFPEGLGCEIAALSSHYIIDPANPYHDYLDGVQNCILEAFAAFAKKTLVRIENAEQGGQLFETYAKVFETQPTWLKSGTPKLRPHRWLAGTVPSSSDYIDLKSNASCSTSLKSAKDIERMKIYIGVLVQRVKVTAAAGLTSEQLKEEVQNAISDEILGNRVSWNPTSESYDSRMTTFTIPFGNGSNQAARVSCDWN